MADVAPGGDSVGHRAQMLVVGGLALAVTIVALGLILNLAIFTENLTTRDVNQEAADATEYQTTSVESVARALRYVNLNDKGTLASGLDRELTRINDRRARYVAGQGGLAKVSVVSTETGTRIRQDDETRKYTNESGTGNWTVATDVERTARFAQRIERSSLTDVRTLGTTVSDINLQLNAYHIAIIDSGGKVWRVYIFQAGGTANAYLTVQEPGESLSGLNLDQLELCTTQNSKVDVDLVENEFGGPCPQLDFFGTTLASSSMSNSYTITYNNTDTLLGSVKGTYDILLDNDSLSSSIEENYASLETDDPFQHQAFFEATIKTTYRTSDVAVTTSRRTQPVASLATFPGFQPRIDTFTVRDNSDGSHAVYNVTWEVTDRDGDLKEVRVHLTNTDSDERVATNKTSISGKRAGPQTSGVSESLGDGSNYAIRLVVIDENGNVVSEKTEDTADGTGP